MFQSLVGKLETDLGGPAKYEKAAFQSLVGKLETLLARRSSFPNFRVSIPCR